MIKLKILIVGGTGCISSAVVEECLRHQMDVTIINRGRRDIPFQDEITLIKADKNDLPTIQSALKNKHYDAVVDFLCFTKEELEKSFELYSNHTSQYFFISSCAVYDLRKADMGYEDGPKSDERWAYSVNKWKAEERLRELASKNKINYTIVRPSVTYGDTRIPYGITPIYGKHGTLIQRILNDKPIIRWNNGENVCNMMRVEDFATAFVRLISNEKAYNTEFNICSENYYSYNQVLEILEKKLSKKIRFFDIDANTYARYLSSRKGEILVDRGSNRKSSLSKFKSIFPDYHEEYDLEKGVGKTVDAYLNQNWMNGISWEFDADCDRIINSLNKEKTYYCTFVDYLGTATKEEIKEYWNAYNKDRLDRKIITFSNRVVRKIQRILGI